MREAAAQGSTAEVNGSPNDHVSFSDVARAHFHWDVTSEGVERDQARGDFQDKLSRFEQQSGVDIVDAYWCQKQASAVALARARTEVNGRPGVIERIFGRKQTPDYRLYRVTDWVTGDVRKLADLMHECDLLAIKAIWGLEGIQRAVVMQWLLAIEAHVLGFIESQAKRQQVREAPPPGTDDGWVRSIVGPAPSELELLHKRVLGELSKIEDYYQDAGVKRARLHYVQGMILVGLPAVIVVAAVWGLFFALFGVLDFQDEGVRTFFACMAAGAIGAIVSVVIRMSGRRGGFTIDHELGAWGVAQLGAYRPLIGAAFGIVISLVVQTFLVPIDQDQLTFELFVVVAFLAGFSERWAKVVLGGAMRTVQPVDGAPDEDTIPPPRAHKPG
jgi:hypothetical protein